MFAYFAAVSQLSFGKYYLLFMLLETVDLLVSFFLLIRAHSIQRECVSGGCPSLARPFINLSVSVVCLLLLSPFPFSHP